AELAEGVMRGMVMSKVKLLAAAALAVAILVPGAGRLTKSGRGGGPMAYADPPAAPAPKTQRKIEEAAEAARGKGLQEGQCRPCHDMTGHGKRTDREVVAAWLDDDAAFLRRVSLDLRGELPSALEVRLFLADKDPKKREKLVQMIRACTGMPHHTALE